MTYFRNFGTPSISRERLELETPNLARRFITRGTNDTNAKLGQTASFDVLIVKIGVGVLAVGRTKKKLAESLDAHFRIFGGQRGVIVSL